MIETYFLSGHRFQSYFVRLENNRNLFAKITANPSNSRGQVATPKGLFHLCAKPTKSSLLHGEDLKRTDYVAPFVPRFEDGGIDLQPLDIEVTKPQWAYESRDAMFIPLNSEQKYDKSRDWDRLWSDSVNSHPLVWDSDLGLVRSHEGHGKGI